MRVEIIPCLQDNYSYLIIDDNNNSACVVDPGEAKPIVDYLKNKNIKLKYILNTHHHFDHTGGNKDLKKEFKSIVVGFKNDCVMVAFTITRSGKTPQTISRLNNNFVFVCNFA